MTEHLAHRDSCRGIGRAEAQNVERMKRKVGTSLRVRPGHNPGHTSKKGKEMEGRTQGEINYGRRRVGRGTEGKHWKSKERTEREARTCKQGKQSDGNIQTKRNGM